MSISLPPLIPYDHRREHVYLETGCSSRNQPFRDPKPSHDIAFPSDSWIATDRPIPPLPPLSDEDTEEICAEWVATLDHESPEHWEQSGHSSYALMIQDWIFDCFGATPVPPWVQQYLPRWFDHELFLAYIFRRYKLARFLRLKEQRHVLGDTRKARAFRILLAIILDEYGDDTLKLWLNDLFKHFGQILWKDIVRDRQRTLTSTTPGVVADDVPATHGVEFQCLFRDGPPPPWRAA